jgi:uncharacterized protein YbaR (Trm112 family)
MFIELIDMLRCPNSHEESWLVLASRRMDRRDVMDGVLGCPVCKAEYSIVEGRVRFSPESHLDEGAEPSNEDEALRLAALLDLASGGGYAIITGALGRNAPHLRALSEVPLLLVNPPPETEMGSGVSGLTLDSNWTALPLAASSARAIAFDDSTTEKQLLAGLRVVRPAGRVLAPIALSVPDGVAELVRDDRQWLAERRAAGREAGIIPLERRARD